MALPVPTFASLDQAAVDQAQQYLFELLAEQFPQVDLSRGVVHDIVLHLGAIVTALLQTLATQINDSSSLLAISQDPALADPALVDQVLSNYRLTRLTGAPASGQVSVLLNAAVPVVVPAGAAFGAGTETFITAQAYAVRTSLASVTDPSDLVLTRVGANFAFAVPVADANVGAAGMVRSGAAMTPTFTIPNFVGACAAGDFTGGYDPETNTALVARLLQGVAAQTFSNRANVDALVHQNPGFTRVFQLSTIGAGDPEMLRDRHGLFPVSGFGRADVYARTALLPVTVVLQKTATLVAVTAAGGVWQFSLASADAPGFYEVAAIKLPGDAPTLAGFSLVSDIRQVDRSGTGWQPDLAPPPAPGGTALEAVYSPFQTATIQFLDTNTPTLGLTVGAATAPYTVAVAAMPQLADLQAFLAGRGVRPYGGDVLVKAPVPCTLRVAFTLIVPPLSAPPDTAAMAQAIASYVNNAGFLGQIYASALVGAIGGLLPAGAVVGLVDMLGRLRAPDGTVYTLRDPLGVMIAVPDLPAVMVSPRTTCFILDPADVLISVAAANTPDV